MITRSLTALAWAVSFLQYGVAAAPTWPSSMDELEDIMFLNVGYQARGFATPITPCTSGGAEGFMSAAQWVRMAFHDMGTANALTGVGGLDASIIYEMGYGTNGSPGFNATLLQLSPFFTSRSGMADLIALSVYTAVRGCGGPSVPIRTGRVDATGQGPNPDVFLPQPQNSFFTFQSQFSRLNFNTPQMIAVVACGHSLGQVHAITFPQIATTGTKGLDSTPAVFDQHVVTDYLDGTTPDPLVKGPAGFASDKKIFSGDGNVTVTSMATPAGFNSMCKTVLQQMVELVPAGVTLTDPIVPYDVKPSALQLTLLSGGDTFSFTGQIRIRTTNIAASQIAAVQLVYVDRNGGSQCGSGGCTISSSYAGSSSGFDDTFVWYAFSSPIPTSTSISAFNVLITFNGGATSLYNNNGAGFPVQDTIMLQSPQSCLAPVGVNQNLTIVAAVRNTLASPAVTLTLTKKVPVSGLNVPSLQKTSLDMSPLSTVGPYTLYAVSSVFNINQLASTNVKFDVSVGTGANLVADSFKNSNRLGSTCAILSPNASTTSTSTASATTASTSATASASSGWKSVGCYADNVGGGRTLRNGQTVPGGAPAMTVELCVAACQAAGYTLAGLEYSQECWCDNTLNYGGGPAPDGNAGCNMPCKGNSLETCGGPNRLNVYIFLGGGSTTSSLSSSTTATLSTSTAVTSASTTASTTASTSATGSSSVTTSVSSSVSSTTSTSASATASAPAGWTAQGCFSDNVAGGRTLRNGLGVPGGSTAMTIEACVATCQAAGYQLAGVEYSQECWCDNSLNFGGGPAPDGSVGCNMPCKGNTLEICGGPNRLNLFSFGSTSTSSSSTSTAASSTTSASTTLSTSLSTSAPLTSSTSATTTSTSSASITSTTTLSTTSSAISTSITSSTISTSTTSSTISTSTTSASTTSASTTSASTTSASTTSTSTISTPASSASASSTSTSSSPASSASVSSTSATSASISSTLTASTLTTSTLTSPSTTTTARTSTTVSTSASATASSVAGWAALGCYTDGVNGGRTLRNGRDVTGAMTVELCIAACKDGDFLLAGVEYAGECYCDNSFNSGGGPASDGNAGCNMPCKGDASETCGGPNRLNVYQNPSYVPVGNPAIPGYTYQGCYNEPPHNRALSWSSTASDSMTVENCATFCNGANYFGVEYGRECYCGPMLDPGSTLQSASSCSFTCAGNALEYCGAGNFLNVYASNNPKKIDAK